ncbi:MAG: potassium channel family protein [Lachnospiraceae bacterium]
MDYLLFLLPAALLTALPALYLITAALRYIRNHKEMRKAVFQKITSVFRNSTLPEKAGSSVLLFFILESVISAAADSVKSGERNAVQGVLFGLELLILVFLIILFIGVLLDSLYLYLKSINEKRVAANLLFIVLYNIFYTIACYGRPELILQYRYIVWGSGVFMLLWCMKSLLGIVIYDFQVVDKKNGIQKWKFIGFMFGLIVYTSTVLVYLTSLCWEDAYNKISGPGDSLYYVIISFSTLGYGDIYPNNAYAKINAAMIGIGSMLFLIAFINGFVITDGSSDDSHTPRPNRPFKNVKFRKKGKDL